MIFLSMSTYYEAYPIIKTLKLKKDTSFTKFQIFRNNDYVILITGCGNINSVIAATCLLSNYEIKERDLFINIGVCGTNNLKYKIGTPFICNKIIEHETKKCFYPDMIYLHPFNEEKIETFPYVLKQENNTNTTTSKLVDMEAAGLYQAARIFLKQNQLIFIKIVSDYINLNDKNVSSGYIEYLIEINTDEIIKWISKINDNLFTDTVVFSEDDVNILNNISEKLKLSVSMKNELKQSLIYYKVRGKNIKKLIDNFWLENNNIKCNSKIERKKYFDKLKEKLL